MNKEKHCEECGVDITGILGKLCLRCANYFGRYDTDEEETDDRGDEE